MKPAEAPLTLSCKHGTTRSYSVYRCRCETCRSAHRRRCYARKLKRKYGITSEEKAVLLARQNGVCAICGRPETANNKTQLCVDHNHRTGFVRGLRRLGYFENGDRLARLLAYLGISIDREPW
ncbi:MAG: endonuclease domain-containing protein [Tepidisphaeraceae bacterium]